MSDSTYTSAIDMRYLASESSGIATKTEQLFIVQEQERKRIASELHDGIGQTLSMLKFGLEDTRRLLAENSIDDAEVLLQLLDNKLDDAINEVRQITMDLRPSILDDLGILATISWLLREFQQIYQTIKVEKWIGLQETDIPHILKTPIYRIIQEAVHNIAKHAQTTRMSIHLDCYNDTIELVIKDYGCGFDTRQAEARNDSLQGYGLTSMRDRALLTGGNCQIDSQPGQGTLIQVRWPLHTPLPTRASTTPPVKQYLPG